MTVRTTCLVVLRPAPDSPQSYESPQSYVWEEFQEDPRPGLRRQEWWRSRFFFLGGGGKKEKLKSVCVMLLMLLPPLLLLCCWGRYVKRGSADAAQASRIQAAEAEIATGIATGSFLPYF